MRFNEVAWMGTEESSYNEWIELKNTGQGEIDLEGWSLVSKDDSPTIELTGVVQGGGLFLLERTDEDTVSNVKANQVYKGSLGNDGENLQLVSPQEEVVSTIGASGGWPAGNNDTKQTMIRCGEEWLDSPETGGSPKKENSCGGGGNEDQATESEEDEPQETTQEDIDDIAPKQQKGYDKEDVLINEFVSDPAEDKEEWVEIKNVSKTKIDIRDWYIEEGGGSRTRLQDSGLRAGEFLVAKDIQGYLNNEGDRIMLKDGDGKLIDEVVYGSWQGKEKDVSAPSSSAAVARDGQQEFMLTHTPTPGKENVISKEEKKEKKEEGRKNGGSSQLIITEIFPNPSGKDDQEFIEFYNQSEQEIELKGWKLANDLGQELEFDPASTKALGIKKEKVDPQDFFVLYKRYNRLVLNDNGGNIQLFSPGSDKPVQTLDYGKADPGFSYADTGHINPSRMSSSTEQFFAHSLKARKWVWSKKPTPGGFNQIKSKNQPPRPLFSFSGKAEPGEHISFDASDTFDENGDNLDYQWEFGDGVTVKGVKTPAHTYLEAGDYQVELMVSDGRATSSLTQEIIVGDPDREDRSSSSATSSEGPQNIEAPDMDLEGMLSANEDISEVDKHYLEVSLSEAKSAPPETFVKVEGRVSVRPGVLGQQYFYISGPPGLQIYNYYKDFPALAVGDRIEVQGETSKSRYGEKRVKTETVKDIEVLSHEKAPTAQEIECKDLDQDHIGDLVKVAGEVVDKEGKKINIQDESEKALFYLQEAVDLQGKELKEGDHVAVSGIASKLDDKVRIMPRSAQDIEYMEQSSSEDAQVLGDTASSSAGSSSWELSKKKTDNKFFKYLSIILGGVVIITSVLLFRKVKN